ncbi:putative vacuolar iron transporter protein [Podospora aff. communis PSN243]|uniref:Vacuolar iron transporter protein n=1 Tax=Podospora aff. communis PSN243 TaxID=3040156 RepID=A0AAV9GJS9_9PEZI|nr:putative vacuolar iron transporter protein [Podospora aff. communis PSN243]
MAPQSTSNKTYSPLPTSSSPSSSTITLDNIINSDDPSAFPPTHHPNPKPLFNLPPLPTLLSNFTLGFADGLTVPFALTAGLSSLGQTKTVISAGLAEICAGSISMGIGGYLAAKRPEGPSVPEQGKGEGEGESEEGLLDSEVEKGGRGGEGDDELRAYLEVLKLPLELEQRVVECVRVNGWDGVSMSGEEEMGSPVLEGVAVAVGYLVGGILPLFPYFFVKEAWNGLVWSFGVCVVALFVFGFAKCWVLNGPRIRTSLWEGGQMVLLGSVAALAAVLCVRLLDGNL